jgi:hypothetical protein
MGLYKGRTFKYDGTVWLVLGDGIYSGYYRCISTQAEFKQINHSVFTNLI